MPDYSKGKVYKLLKSIDDEIYVGTTIQPLRKRLCEHKQRAKDDTRNHKLKEHMIKIGVGNFYIELIENCPCNSKEELFAKEGEWIRKISTLNKIIQGRTTKEWRDDNKQHIKQYIEDNKERLKHWKQENSEHIKDYQKIYREIIKNDLNKVERHT